MSRYILAVDQSTQGTKGLLFNEDGELVCRADRPHRQIISPLGWVSHDPEEIRRNTLAVCRDTVEKAGIDKGSIAAFGISNQRETTVAWDRETGKSICDAIVWQCARAEAVCERLSDMADTVRARTGLNLSPYFPAAKMGWIMENVPEAKKLADEGRLCLGTVDSWLLSFLTKEKVHATDYSNASRTQLFDIIALRWDEELCRAFGVPVEALPEVRMSDSVFGTTDLDGYLDKPIPICGVLGDSHGALFGQDCRRPGQVKATYGTGWFLLLNTGNKACSADGGLITTLCACVSGRPQYALEGSVFIGGAAVQWLRDGLGIISSAAETEELAERVADSAGLYFVPAFNGLGAPYWDSSASGMLCGITRGAKKEHVVRAVLEGIAYRVNDVLHAMEAASGVNLSRLSVDGGASANNFLMRFQADISGCCVARHAITEVTSLGAAYIAGLSCGFWGSEGELRGCAVTERLFSPTISASKREELLEGWRHAVAKSRL